MPGGPQSCPLGDFPSSLAATSALLLSLLELLVPLVSVGCFIRTRLLVHTCLLVGPVTLDSGRGKHRLERQGLRVLEGHLQEQRMLGASAATPGNDLLLREFKDKGFYKGVHTRE